MIVLDTNVLAEMMKPAEQRSVSVMLWLDRQPGERLYTTAITIAEIRFGLAMMPDGRRRTEKREAAERLLALFEGRVLAFELGSTPAFVETGIRAGKSGREPTGFDNLIAAIASANGMAVATRNTRHFEDCGIDVINPWEA